ncbi:MAG: ThuA domain-containing protein [Betaproteobacteria bacterium]|nr:MAG: ThuA domain-containing protein [Betaproteobacteria bacterium]
MTFNVKDINSKPEMTGKALLAASAAVLWGISAPVFADSRQDNDSDSVDLTDSRISGDFDYGVCRGTNPNCYHDWVGAGRQNKVLVYTRTAGPRHANLGPALPAGLNPPLDPARHIVQTNLIRLLNAEGIAVDWTEDVTRVSNLNSYKAVIFASTSRDALWNHSVGGQVHNAFGTEYNWQYYEGLLGNANYYDHGAFQTGVVQIINDRDVSTAGLPARWTFSDEWYNLVPFPTKVRFLALVDEDSLETKHSVHPGFPKFHPVAWCQYYDGGRAWVTTLGHINTAFTAGSALPGAAEFQKMIVGGIKSAMGLEPFCQPGSHDSHDDHDKDRR